MNDLRDKIAEAIHCEIWGHPDDDPHMFRAWAAADAALIAISDHFRRMAEEDE